MKEMLDKYIREVREALENEIEKGDLQAELVFILSQQLDSLVVSYCKKDLYDEKGTDSNEAVANSIINIFLKQNNLNIGDLKNRANISDRNELITKMREEAGFSIRRTAKYLGLNRGLVQKSRNKIKQNLYIKN
jgi:hypothetical protein